MVVFDIDISTMDTGERVVVRRWEGLTLIVTNEWGRAAGCTQKMSGRANRAASTVRRSALEKG